VNWIRAKSRHDRWKEELEITKHEMVWVLLWFQTQVALWKSCARAPPLPGMDAYAYRQAAQWEYRRRLALAEFSSVNTDLPQVYGYCDIDNPAAI
jgi:hypothetical protein